MGLVTIAWSLLLRPFALPQSVVQSMHDLMGNDPTGVHVYIDTKLFRFAIIMVGSLVWNFMTVALTAIELHQYGCALSGWSLKSVKFETFGPLPWVSI